MSANGIKTAFWGPHAWAFLFSSIAGSYPVRYDPSNKTHVKILKSFQSMFASLEYTLPCIYCRESYGKFIKELPMTNFISSRKEMMKWLYLIHDKVNAKLMKQEKECYESDKLILMNRKMSANKLKVLLKNLKSEIMITKPSPPFERVIAIYERNRAGCNKKSKKCA